MLPLCRCSLDVAVLQSLLQVTLPGGGGVEVPLGVPVTLQRLLP
ncbi:hypothetical protein [Kineococcus radiotolerans]|nr:hypothetical protein [Kineococcus radiotolerans]